MDDDVDIANGDHDMTGNTEIFTDFSQVKIEVHEADVAERIIEDLAGDTEDQDCLVYPDSDPENDIEEMQENYLEPLPENCQEQVSEDYIRSTPEDHEVSDYSQDFSDYAEIPIKEEPTDYTEFDEEAIVPYDDELPPEDIYHFNNKIILGSKPCVSTVQACDVEEYSKNEDEYQNGIAKEYLYATVLLDDWAIHLENSTSFCKECEILFATPNALDAHNTTTHSFLVAVSKNVAVKSTTKPAFARKSTSNIAVKSKSQNLARKRTGTNNVLTSKFCNHCNMVFPDHTALIKHLYELLPLKQFKCTVCDAVFNNQKELIDHNSVHIKLEKPKIKKERMTKEETNLRKKLLYEEDIKKKRPVSPRKEIDALPMSVLFQCTKCNMHFLTSFAGWQHYTNCNGKGYSRKTGFCKTCKRKLRDLDATAHKKQHEICTKFKVYKVTRNLFERTLCKCPKCGVHFNDLTIKPHIRNCGKIPTAHCQKCNILVPKTNLDLHSNKHIKQNLKPKDFVIVQYFIKNKTLKRKLEPIATPTKKIKLESTATKKNKKENLDKIVQKCIMSKIKTEPTQQTKKEEKETGRKMKMVNRLKFEKGNNKVRMYFCKHCNGCCVRDSRRTFHLSKKCKVGRLSERVICQECGLQFTRKTIMSHRRLHKRRRFTIQDIVFYDIGTVKKIVPTIPNYPQCPSCKIIFFSKHVQTEHICGENYETCKYCREKFDNSAYEIHLQFHKLDKGEKLGLKVEAKLMPELIKKYESLNMMWNIIYCCKKCDIVTDMYDKAVEHSQTHLNHMTTQKTIKCYICSLKFDETCWSKHSDLHSRMNINSKDFKILIYNPNKLLTEDWFQLFESLPEDQIRQITDGSLYGCERSVKMKLLKDGRSEFTVYCCSNCNVCYHHNEIVKHATAPTCKSTGNSCKICSLKFNDNSSLKYHEILHLQGIQKEEFRVVSFLNEKHVKGEHIPSSNKYIIYKCTNCNGCLMCKGNIARHQCHAPHRSAKCSKCHESFHKSFTAKHKLLHRKHPDFNITNTKIEYFDPSNKIVKRKYVKKSMKVLKKPAHLPKIKDSPMIAKADTSKTKIEMKTAEVFKCDCGLHFTSKQTIEKHMETCSTNSDISAENCSKCGLLFPTDVLVSHLCKHHSKNTKIIVIDDYRRIKPSEEAESSFGSVESTSETSAKETRPVCQKEAKPAQNREAKLYKCSDCNVYYMTQTTCYKHVYKNHQLLDPRQFIECKLCSLQFTIKTLPIHISKHHQKEFSLDSVLVEEYHPPVGKGPPKIDIYIASEKIQSVQVTSSMEESRFNS